MATSRYTALITFYSLLITLNMFETSKDILFLVLAVSVAVFTIFLVWLVAEVAIMLRRFNRFVGEIQEIARKIERTLAAIRDKLEHSANVLPALVKGVTELVRWFAGGQETKNKRKK